MDMPTLSFSSSFAALKMDVRKQLRFFWNANDEGDLFFFFLIGSFMPLASMACNCSALPAVFGLFLVFRFPGLAIVQIGLTSEPVQMY